MLIKFMRDVATGREKKLLKNVRWRKIANMKKSGFTQKGLITGIWKLGCSLVTSQSLREGETIWIKARDDHGQPLLSQVGTVIWSESCFRLDGYRCEVRFRSDLRPSTA